MHRLPFPTLQATSLCVAVLFFVCGANAEDSPRDPDGEKFFLEQIEPILKESCFHCHSHEAGEMEGSLTLDSRSGWAEGGDRGPAVVPGDPENSLLMKVVEHGNEDLQMPPDDKLPAAQIELLRQWIQRDAPDPRRTRPVAKEKTDPLDWWSLRPLVRSEVPESLTSNAKELNPIDAFVQAALAKNEITPVQPASRRALIRRVYFDLHGLPPTPQQVTEFQNDESPSAYEKLIDRLLASPRYGERWARHWLDTVHFADSHGCEHDVYRPNAWRYRDYVIESLNRDTTWSRFIREQLAADYFFPKQPQLTRALGFIAAGPLELSRARTAPVTFDYLDRDDMVTQTMASFASSTANCARCHDHKFDPISQEDYYSLQAVFAGVGKGDIDVDDDPSVARKRRHLNMLLSAVATKSVPADLTAEESEAIAGAERSTIAQLNAWKALPVTTYLSSGGATLHKQDDGALLASGHCPDTDVYTVTCAVPLKNLAALRLDVLTDESLPKKGPGRQANGSLLLSEFEVTVFDPESGTSERMKFEKATADFSRDRWPIANAIDGNPETVWGFSPQIGRPHRTVFQLKQPMTVTAGSTIAVVLKQLHGEQQLIGRMKLYATEQMDASFDAIPDDVRLAVTTPLKQRTNEQQAVVAGFALKPYAEARLGELPTPTQVYAVSSSHAYGDKLKSPAMPRVVHVLGRGNIQKPGDVANPGALSAIATLPGRFEVADANNEALRRVALANWLANRDNPLTWRSIVNRVWMFHFGTGLCETPNDFGRMGGVPSHPELLDWLAVWFRDDANGSLKQLHRLIMLSDTYKRSSHTPRVAADEVGGHKTDGQNRLLWRMTRRPMDAESFRDAVLQICGRIDLTMGGPGVQQFTMSEGSQLTPKLHYDKFDWGSSDAGRRSIYRVVWRGIADPFMETLDFPDLGLLTPKRGKSVSALQALAAFNNDFVLHHSEVLAGYLQTQHSKVKQQIQEACRLILLRDAGAEELAALETYSGNHGLPATCRLLFNSNEFNFVE